LAERIGEVALVTHVLDGDTIDVQIEDKTYRARYIGIDSPEDGQPISQEATEFNRQMVEGKKVILEKDISETDRYNRLLRYAYLPDGTFVNAMLVGAGFARAVAYPPDVKFHDYLTQIEQEAQANSLGIWAPSIEITPTITVSQTTPGIFIDPTCSQFNAPGNDNDNKNEEYVCITNPGSAAIDISAWSVNDEYGWKYTFPNFILDAGASLKLHTGCGTDTSLDLYWCRDETAIWNNGGDCAYLSDASGVRIHEYCY
jgi:endonuclease YncB( thermonuclease family)